MRGSRGDLLGARALLLAGGGDVLDPSGGLSVFDAVNKQLGLKLEMRKRPMPVLVIDSMQEKPEN